MLFGILKTLNLPVLSGEKIYWSMKEKHRYHIIMEDWDWDIMCSWDIVFASVNTDKKRLEKEALSLINKPFTNYEYSILIKKV